MRDDIADLAEKIKQACKLVSDVDTELTLHNQWECEQMLNELSWADFSPELTMAMCLVLACANSRRLAVRPPLNNRRLRVAG